MQSDYYEILGVSKDATEEQIATAYRKKALKYHPDVNSDPEAVEKFKQAAEAYDILSDSNKRSHYDRGSVGQFHESFEFNPEEIFSRVFRNPPWQQHGRDRGRDARAVVVLTFEEAVLGCKKEVKITVEEKCKCERGYSSWDKCTACNGSGEVVLNYKPWVMKSTCSSCNGGGQIPKEKCNECKGRGFLSPKNEIVPIDIPAGIEDGMRISIPCKGQQGITGQRGTLHVSISVRQHPLFTRSGADIYCTVPVTYTQLVLGDFVDVPTVTGASRLRINPGTTTNRKLRLKGLGAPDLKFGKHGDLYVVLDLEVPQRLDAEYKSEIDKLKDLESKHISDRIKKFREVKNEG